MSIHTKEISIAAVLLTLAAQTGQVALASRQKWKALSFWLLLLEFVAQSLEEYLAL